MAIIDKIQLSGTVYTIGNETTTAVTSASTDNEIPTAKAVYDAIPQGGGGKAIEAGRGITITTGETADTVSFNLPISAGTGTNSIIEGSSTSAMSDFDHAEGCKTYAKGNGYAAHAEGFQTSAMTPSSHAEGRSTKANGNYSHAEGLSTVASGENSHAEGSGTVANGNYSHAEGYFTSASSVSNVSGINTYFGYQARHAEGYSTLANNASTHTEGYHTIANNFGEHASGVYNNSTSATTIWGNSGNTLFSVGNGTSNSERHNAFEIRQNGDIYITKDGQDVKLQDQLGGGGGGSITIDPSLDSGSTNPVANSAITNAINSKMDEVNFASFYGNQYSAGLKGYYYDSQTETQTEKFNWGMVWQSDGSIGFDALGNLAVFNKIDTSAITTSVTSSSTDSQVPSAKAVYDIVGNIETLLSKI